MGPPSPAGLFFARRCVTDSSLIPAWPYPGIPRRRIIGTLSLVALGEGNEDRFVRVFRAAWKRIPLAARRELLKHWKERRSGECQTASEPFPYITLQRHWRGVTGAEATWKTNTGELAFYAPVVDLMPDEALEVLILHEVGHAYLDAIGEDSASTDPEYTGCHLDCEEMLVDQLMLWWCIDVEPLSRCEAAHRDELRSLLASQGGYKRRPFSP